MTAVLVVCEGQTEETFVRVVLAPFLSTAGVAAGARLLQTSPGHAGGGLGRTTVLNALREALREPGDHYVATLFDLYGIPRRFPGLSAARRERDPVEQARRIEEGLHARVVETTGCRPERFLPHVQPYEFESLLFTEVEVFPEVRPTWEAQMKPLRTAYRTAPSPEHINDGDGTQPSKRLAVLDRYKKTLHGVEIARRIGIGRIRAECRHFDGWVSRLEQLSPGAEA